MFNKERWLGVLPKPVGKKGYTIYSIVASVVILIGILFTVLYFTGSKDESDLPDAIPVDEGSNPDGAYKPVGTDLSDPVTTIEEVVVSVISINLKITGIKGKNAVDIVLKNTAETDATYKLRSKDLYEYKIYAVGSTTPVKSGTHGTLDKEELNLKSEETKNMVFDYSSIYAQLPEGHYTIEVKPNSDDLSGFRSSQSFSVGDFSTSVDGETLNGNFVIREIVTSDKGDGTKKMSLIGVLNGVTLVTLNMPLEMKGEITKFKPDSDILYITYSSKAGEYTLTAFEKVKE